jgi:Zn-finger nucleic acid-binding protein
LPFVLTLVIESRKDKRMKCPVDKVDMLVVEHQKIELDYCHKCTGVWFDSGELDLLVSALQAQGANISQADLLAPQEAEVNEDKRKCPVCGHKMVKTWIGNAPKVLIDSCPIGDGLWFDGGELHQVLCQMEAKGQTGARDVLSFLSETFQADCHPQT